MSLYNCTIAHVLCVEHVNCRTYAALLSLHPVQRQQTIKGRIYVAIFQNARAKKCGMSNRRSEAERERETDSAICRKWIGCCVGRDLAVMPIFREICFYFRFRGCTNRIWNVSNRIVRCCGTNAAMREVMAKGNHINFHFTVQQQQ